MVSADMAKPVIESISCRAEDLKVWLERPLSGCWVTNMKLPNLPCSSSTNFRGMLVCFCS